MTRSANAQPAVPATEFPWGGVSILLVLAVLLGGLARLGAQPLRLELYGDLQRTQNGAIAAQLRPVLEKGFFTASAREVLSELEALPWIAGAQAEFLWPDRLALWVQEHRPLAAIESGGVLTDAGTVIATTTTDTLPVVRGKQHRAKDIAEVLQLVKEACAACVVRGLELRAGNQLSLQLAWSGHVMRVELGRPDWRNALERLTTHALPALQPRLAQVETIDLRYRHAFAVRWSEEVSMEQQS